MDVTTALAAGYRLTDLTTHPDLARETPAYSANLTHAGDVVATVTSDGGGGAPLLDFTDHAHHRNFVDAAKRLTAEDEVPGYLPAEEDLLNELYIHAIIAADLSAESRTHLLVQLPGDGDMWQGGNYRAIALRGLDPAAVLAFLREKHPDLRVWDEKEGTFI